MRNWWRSVSNRVMTTCTSHSLSHGPTLTLQSIKRCPETIAHTDDRIDPPLITAIYRRATRRHRALPELFYERRPSGEQQQQQLSVSDGCPRFATHASLFIARGRRPSGRVSTSCPEEERISYNIDFSRAAGIHSHNSRFIESRADSDTVDASRGGKDIISHKSQWRMFRIEKHPPRLILQPSSDFLL